MLTKNCQGFKEQKPKPILLFLSAHQLLGPLQQASRILVAKVHTHELCQGRGGSREGSETPFLAGQGTQRRELAAQGHWELDPGPWALQMRVWAVCHRVGATLSGPNDFLSSWQPREQQSVNHPPGLRNTARSNWN